MHLKSLQFWSDNKNGWQSKELKFGKSFTFVHGENSCGKTPLLRSIFFALGMQASFRNDIIENATGVKLDIELSGVSYIFKRKFSDNYKVQVIYTRDGSEQIFTSEKDTSKFIFEQLGYPHAAVTSNRNTETQIYFSTIAPLFWKEQLGSWDVIYHVSSRFISDQREEATRFVLGLTPKNPYGVKAEIKRERKNVDKITEEIADRNEIVKELEEIFGQVDSHDIGQMETKRTEVKAQLTRLQGDFSSLSNVSKDFDSVIYSKQIDIGRFQAAIADRTSRIRSLKHIVNEVAAEADTLSLNDDAAERFRSLESVCSNTGCGMFVASKEAYGKSLLYLKDQMKDLETNIKQLDAENVKTEEGINLIRQEIDEIEKKKNEALQKSGVEKVASAIQLIASQLVDLETKIATAERMKKQRTRLENLLLKREKTYEKIEDLEETKKAAKEKAVKEARRILGSKVNEWKDSLHLTAVDGDAVFEAGFDYKFGTEKYKQLDGSARTRAVLAFHAALLELALEKGNHPKIFILDTPKQQELKTNDLKDYFDRLRVLSNKYPDLQIIFSSSEFNFVPTDNDRIWEPEYPGEEHPMYLGVAGTEITKIPDKL